MDQQADQNIGNGFVLQPQEGNATVIPQTNPERLLKLTGPSGTAQTTSVVLTASRLVGQANPYPGFPGPITGIIEFGNGSQITKAEVDIPIGPFDGSVLKAAAATEPQDGGIIITVPTGVLRIYARYDNRLLQSLLNVFPPQSVAQYQGKPIVGPGGPTNIGGKVIPAEPVLVKAMSAYFSRHTSKVFRTHYLYVPDQAGIPVPITMAGVYCVPAFARSVRVLREPITASIDVTISDNCGYSLNKVNVAANTSPSIPIEGTGTIVSIASNSGGAGDKVRFLALCYEIGI